MSVPAFLGSADVKQRLVEPVRAQWNARALVPDGALQWGHEGRPASLAGALAKTCERATFEERTGIPVDLALLCELLVAMGTRKVACSEAPCGFTLEGAAPILSFGSEWLDAIRPGADLRPVVPGFARRSLGLVLHPDFALAPYITPRFREVGEQIAALWDREAGGDPATRAQWRSVQAAALDADADTTPAWGFRVATFLEAMAWPAVSISGEFVGHFEPLLFNWLYYLEVEHLTEWERRDREHFLVGWRAMAIAPRDNAGTIDGDPLAALPESQRVMSPEYIAAMMARSNAVREVTRPRKEAVLRSLMDTLVSLIRNA